METFLEEGTSSALADVGKRRQEIFDAADHLRDPAWALSTVWDTPGELHPDPRLKCGQLVPGQLANIAVWDPDHPHLWPAARQDPHTSLVRCSNIGAALAGLMVAGRWVGDPRGPGAGGDFQASVLGSSTYDDHRREAEERLESLLRRSGVAS